MIFGYIVLFVALLISVVSAYYSILGLTAIFSASVVPIIIMGAALELGKISGTLWLHYYWERALWRLKIYLVPAIVMLMFLSSMGIFGYLSKSHSSQSLVSGDVAAKVQIFDEKIKTQQDNIVSDRKVLTQMDAAVDQLVGRTDDAKGVNRSLQVRRSQAKERDRVQADIDTAQSIITKLQEDRAPVAAEVRKVVADTGPIIYIAALIYGDNPSQNLLESAVRWVIIIIVSVFDPLAIVLLLAATSSIEWERDDRKKRLSNESEQTISTQVENLPVPILEVPIETEIIVNNVDIMGEEIKSDNVFDVEQFYDPSYEHVDNQVVEEPTDHVDLQLEEIIDTNIEEPFRDPIVTTSDQMAEFWERAYQYKKVLESEPTVEPSTVEPSTEVITPKPLSFTIARAVDNPVDHKDAAFDKQYVDHLIMLIGNGKITVDELSIVEQEQVRAALQQATI